MGVDRNLELENTSACQSQHKTIMQLPQIEHRHTQSVAISRIFVSEHFEPGSKGATEMSRQIPEEELI